MAASRVEASSGPGANLTFVRSLPAMIAEGVKTPDEADLLDKLKPLSPKIGRLPSKGAMAKVAAYATWKTRWISRN